MILSALYLLCLLLYPLLMPVAPALSTPSTPSNEVFEY